MTYGHLLTATSIGRATRDIITYKHKNKKGSIVMDIKIIYKPTNEIVPYENNPRLNDEAIEPVANSIKQFRLLKLAKDDG